jgi:hypothetical protein
MIDFHVFRTSPKSFPVARTLGENQSFIIIIFQERALRLNANNLGMCFLKSHEKNIENSLLFYTVKFQ